MQLNSINFYAFICIQMTAVCLYCFVVVVVVSFFVHSHSLETNIFTFFFSFHVHHQCSSYLNDYFTFVRSCSSIIEWKGKYKAGLRTSSSSLLLLIFIITTKNTTRTDLKLVASRTVGVQHCNTARGPDETLRRFEIQTHEAWCVCCRETRKKYQKNTRVVVCVCRTTCAFDRRFVG